jgi:hypothetical protein
MVLPDSSLLCAIYFGPWLSGVSAPSLARKKGYIMKISNIKFLFYRYRLKDVFTPTTIAKLTYIKRNVIEKELEKYITLPGMQIVVYGHSGSGKTTLIMNMLNQLERKSIKTSCTEATTYNQLLIDAFDRLERYYTCEISKKNESTVANEISLKYKDISTSLKNSDKYEYGTKETRVVPLQLTPQRLAEFLGESKYIWIIEDFHKVKLEEKRKLAQILKVFMDCSSSYPDVKIICIGAVSTARELIQYDKELTNRVAEIQVPLMSKDELKQIVDIGFRYMNIDRTNTEIISKITHYSNSLASVCHHLCYDICYNNGIRKTPFFKKTIGEQDFIKAVKSYLSKNSDTFTKNYEKACSITRCKQLLHEIIERNEETFDPRIDIDGNKVSDENKLKDRLEIMSLLSTQEYGEIFRINSDSKNYMFSSPFFQTYLKMKYAMEKSDKELKEKTRNFELHQMVNSDSMFKSYIDIMENNLSYDVIFTKDFNIEKEITYQKCIDRPVVKMENMFLTKKNIRKQNRDIGNKAHNYYKKR